MPIYEIDIGGKTHEIESENALTDEQIGQYAKSLAAPQTEKPSRVEIPGAPPGVQAPAYREPSAPFAATKAPRGSVAEQLGRVGDVGSGFWRAAGRGAGAVVQMLEEPVRAVTGTPTQNYGPRIAAKTDELLGPENPVTEAPGAMALGGGVARALPMAAATGGALARVGQAATTGGVVAATSQPVAGGKDYPLEKAKQIGMGAALGGGLQGATEAAGAGVRAAKQAYFGTPGPEQQRLWDRAKEMGFSVRPDQARQDEYRMLQSGFGSAEKHKNQTAANTAATQATGRASRNITPEFLQQRHAELGAEYDRIYAPGTNLKVDLPAVQGLENFLSYQQHVGYPWTTREAQTAADRIVAAYRRMNTGTARNVKMNIDAADVQLLRNELTSSARRTSNDLDRWNLGQIVDEIDQSVARNHPQLAAELTRLRPQYRALVTLDKAAAKGIVDPQGNISAADLGRMLRTTDDRYIQGASGNPLQELGQVGESFGIRRMGQAPVTAGKGTTSGGISDEVPTTRAGAIRTGIQAAKAAVQPITGRVHDRYIREYSPRGAPPVSTMESATAKGVLGAQGANARMGDYKDIFWKRGQQDESSDR